MEHSIRLVETHCAKYLDMFGECVQQFPYTWQMDCESQRRKLAKCAETKPEIVHIKTECGKEFVQYERCMTENQTDAEKCSLEYSRFSQCAENALETFKVNKVENKVSKGQPPDLLSDANTSDK